MLTNDSAPKCRCQWVLHLVLRPPLETTDLYVGRHREGFVLRHLQPAIPGERPSQRRWKLADVLTQRSYNRGRVLTRHLPQHAETRSTFHQRDHITVIGTGE
jgi:hypothetical protein